MIGIPKGPHITRYSLYKRLQECGPTLPLKEGKVLSISHSENLVDLLGIKATEIVPADYPEVSIFDLGFPDSTFDFVVSDQVLEHIEGYPSAAIEECHRVLKPGGIAIHTTCFVNPVHGFPKDFWRYTPDALRLLHQTWSEVLEVDGWGNFDVWAVAVRDGMRHYGTPLASWHPLYKLAVKNDPEWPICTWVIAKK